MPLAVLLASLFNTIEPGIASIVTLIRKKDGTISVVTYLDEADAQFAANLKQITDWFAANPTVVKP